MKIEVRLAAPRAIISDTFFSFFSFYIATSCIGYMKHVNDTNERN